MCCFLFASYHLNKNEQLNVGELKFEKLVLVAVAMDV